MASIQEVIRSGKRFKRPHMLTYHFYGAHYEALQQDHSLCRYGEDDILADDWKVEEEIIEITRSQLAAAMNQCGVTSSRDVQNRIAKELGFKSC